MRIGVTYADGQIFQHFGHTEEFKIYDVEDGRVTASEVVSTNGSGHGALAGVLKTLKVDVLICGGIGGGAQKKASGSTAEQQGAQTRQLRLCWQAHSASIQMCIATITTTIMAMVGIPAATTDVTDT